jgi:hypothetical protein
LRYLGGNIWRGRQFIRRRGGDVVMGLAQAARLALERVLLCRPCAGAKRFLAAAMQLGRLFFLSLRHATSARASRSDALRASGFAPVGVLPVAEESAGGGEDEPVVAVPPPCELEPGFVSGVPSDWLLRGLATVYSIFAVAL